MYDGAPSNLFMKVIGNEYLVSIVLNAVIVLNTHFLWCILVFYFNAVQKQRRRFGIKPFFVSGAKELWICVKLGLTDAEGS